MADESEYSTSPRQAALNRLLRSATDLTDLVKARLADPKYCGSDGSRLSGADLNKLAELVESASSAVLIEDDKIVDAVAVTAPTWGAEERRRAVARAVESGFAFFGWEPETKRKNLTDRQLMDLAIFVAAGLAGSLEDWGDAIDHNTLYEAFRKHLEGRHGRDGIAAAVINANAEYDRLAGSPSNKDIHRAMRETSQK